MKIDEFLNMPKSAIRRANEKDVLNIKNELLMLLNDKSEKYDKEHYPYPTYVFVAIGDEGEHGIEVNPDKEEDKGRDEQLMERHLAAQSVYLVPVTVFYSLRYHRTGDGSQRTVGHLNDVGDIRGYRINACECQTYLGPKEQRIDQRDVSCQDG